MGSHFFIFLSYSCIFMAVPLYSNSKTVLLSLCHHSSVTSWPDSSRVSLWTTVISYDSPTQSMTLFIKRPLSYSICVYFMDILSSLGVGYGHFLWTIYSVIFWFPKIHIHHICKFIHCISISSIVSAHYKINKK